MRLLTLTAAALLALPTAALATHPHGATTGPTIQIACFRGPWQEIIWDRPEVSFTDDLVAVGYSEADALAIGTRICRDPQGVSDPNHMVGVLQGILRSEPPRRR